MQRNTDCGLNDDIYDTIIPLLDKRGRLHGMTRHTSTLKKAGSHAHRLEDNRSQCSS